MDARTREEWEASLERYLAEDTDRLALSPRGRLAWLSHHLALYAGRLAGWAALADGPSAELREHGVFGMVEIGAERVEAELRLAGTPEALAARWGAVRAALAAAQRTPDRAHAERLRVAAAEWEAAVAATQW